MIGKLSGLVSRVHSWIWNLPVAGIALAGAITLAAVGGGGFYAYQTYDYVQHDNDFCLSCHLMVDPYERFAQSAHRGLGCKACHQPNLIDRSTMALTQIVESPEELGVHAEVPNERCAECHIDGDPEKWELVSQSAGHRVHFESTDSTLQGLQCVECHSTSVHEFAATDNTCAQSGCHDDNKIMLGAMSDLTIHCAACHGFSTPVDEGQGPEVVEAALAPDRNTCLSCHEMRVLVEMPDPDPHEGVCASCHNPHTQATPQDAVESCASAGCHTEADTITPFHRGLEPGTLETCTSCHLAHDFHNDGTDCVGCHTNIGQDDPTVPRRKEGAEAVRAGVTAMGIDAGTAARAVHAQGVGVGWSPTPPIQEAPAFLHSQHPDLGCANCHQSEERHGALTVSTLRDCRSCHHVEPTSDDCARCHQASSATGDPYALVRTMDLTVGAKPNRTLPFDHDDHVTEDCASCHTEGLEMSAFQVDCTSCHEKHHDAEVNCARCHADAPNEAHPIATAHVTCSGSGCHTELPFDVMPRDRNACLVCHQDMADHRPGGDCAECHVLPEAKREVGS